MRSDSISKLFKGAVNRHCSYLQLLHCLIDGSHLSSRTIRILCLVVVKDGVLSEAFEMLARCMQDLGNSCRFGVNQCGYSRWHHLQSRPIVIWEQGHLAVFFGKDVLSTRGCKMRCGDNGLIQFGQHLAIEFNLQPTQLHRPLRWQLCDGHAARCDKLSRHGDLDVLHIVVTHVGQRTTVAYHCMIVNH